MSNLNISDKEVFKGDQWEPILMEGLLWCLQVSDADANMLFLKDDVSLKYKPCGRGERYKSSVARKKSSLENPVHFFMSSFSLCKEPYTRDYWNSEKWIRSTDINKKMISLCAKIEAPWERQVTDPALIIDLFPCECPVEIRDRLLFSYYIMLIQCYIWVGRGCKERNFVSSLIMHLTCQSYKIWQGHF